MIERFRGGSKTYHYNPMLKNIQEQLFKYTRDMHGLGPAIVAEAKRVADVCDDGWSVDCKIDFKEVKLHVKREGVSSKARKEAEALRLTREYELKMRELEIAEDTIEIDKQFGKAKNHRRINRYRHPLTNSKILPWRTYL